MDVPCTRRSRREFSEAYSPLGLHPEAGVEIEAFVLKAPLAAARRRGLRCTRRDGTRRRARARTGRALLAAEDGLRSTRRCTRCAPSAAATALPGPALIESDDTTLVVAPRWAAASTSHRQSCSPCERGRPPACLTPTIVDARRCALEQATERELADARLARRPGDYEIYSEISR